MAFSGNPLSSITIPAGLDLAPAAMGQHGAAFLDFYAAGGRRAGTYEFMMGDWGASFV